MASFQQLPCSESSCDLQRSQRFVRATALERVLGIRTLFVTLCDRPSLLLVSAVVSAEAVCVDLLAPRHTSRRWPQTAGGRCLLFILTYSQGWRRLISWKSALDELGETSSVVASQPLDIHLSPLCVEWDVPRKHFRFPLECGGHPEEGHVWQLCEL